MAGKGGGAWKVAYADFVTAMMAFFLVMWLVNQSKPVKEAVANYFEDPLGTGTVAISPDAKGSTTTIGPLDGGMGPGTGMRKTDIPKTDEPELDEASDAKPPRLLIFHELDRTRTKGTLVMFENESTTIDAQGRKQLNGLLPALLGKPNKIEIRGHASRRPLPEGSPYKDAWELCYARCLATMKYLEEQGVTFDRIRLSQDRIHEPYSLRPEPAWEALNSRVEVFVTSEFAFQYRKNPDEAGGYFGEPTDELLEKLEKDGKPPAPPETPAPAEPKHHH